jgi:hypothetical protein
MTSKVKGFATTFQTSSIEHLPSMYKAIGSVPSTAKKKTKTQNEKSKTPRHTHAACPATCGQLCPPHPHINPALYISNITWRTNLGPRAQGSQAGAAPALPQRLCSTLAGKPTGRAIVFDSYGPGNWGHKIKITFID